MAGHNNIDARLRNFNFMPVAVPCERTIQPNALALRHRTTQQIDKHLCAYTWDFYSDFIARIPICFSSEYKRTKWISTYREFNMYFSCMFNNWSNRSRWQANWKQKLLVFDRHTKFLDTILVAVIIRVHECCWSWRCKTENIDWIRTESVFDIHVWWFFSLEWIVTFAYVSFSKLQQCRLTLLAQSKLFRVYMNVYAASVVHRRLNMSKSIRCQHSALVPGVSLAYFTSRRRTQWCMHIYILEWSILIMTR